MERATQRERKKNGIMDKRYLKGKQMRKIFRAELRRSFFWFGLKKSEKGRGDF
jgi:hypothetical protein